MVQGVGLNGIASADASPAQAREALVAIFGPIYARVAARRVIVAARLGVEASSPPPKPPRHCGCHLRLCGDGRRVCARGRGVLAITPVRHRSQCDCCSSSVPSLPQCNALAASESHGSQRIVRIVFRSALHCLSPTGSDSLLAAPPSHALRCTSGTQHNEEGARAACESAFRRPLRGGFTER